ncbi:MAG TPA: Holliday junction resolvase RuvX [Steroidobacteraceae bacterium]|nr:Holliday junction resolvase RuvX [Steroidobacteraceae bacterium]
MPDRGAGTPQPTAGGPHRPQVVLGFDYGTRRIGAAIGDTLTRTARPLVTVERRDAVRAEQTIARLVADYAPQRLLVGVPYNMSGSETPLTRPAQAFARMLERRFHLPVDLVDERLSSREAESAIRSARRAGIRPRRARHADVDREAARIIVERWLVGETTVMPHEEPSEPAEP